MRILVDADACPVKDEIVKVAGRHKIPVVFVANRALRVPEGFEVSRIVVSDGFDAADDWIAEETKPTDIVITADIPLADRCLKAAGTVIGPSGRPFDNASIGNAMAMRDLSAHLRETGAIAGGNPSFTKKDRSTFLQALENAVQTLKRNSNT